jgi:PAS domain S-box-containing protein
MIRLLIALISAALAGGAGWWFGSRRRMASGQAQDGLGAETQKLLNTVATPVMSIDRDFNIEMINEAASGMVGKKPSELVGTKCYDLFRTEHCRTEHCALARAMREGRPVATRTVASPGGKGKIPILYSGAPRYGTNGDIVGATEFVQEISAIVQAQEATQAGVQHLGGTVQGLEEVLLRQQERTTRMARSSQSVAGAAHQMDGNFGSVGAAVEQTHGIFQSIAGAVEEMNASIGEIARGTTHANEIAGNAVQGSRRLAERVQDMTVASEEINSIVNTIIRISEQTKLLALNATIEAARAGSAGKGFAVVAGEVKELARQTSEAIVDIQNKVGNITGTTAKTAAEIGEIGGIIEQINETVGTIAAALEEQSVTTGEITHSITEAVQGLQEVTRNVGEASTAAGEIARQTGELSSGLNEVERENSGLGDSCKRLTDVTDRLRQAAEALN